MVSAGKHHQSICPHRRKEQRFRWYEYDYASWCAIGLLYIVEFADWNTQSKIGKGYSSGSSAIPSGGTDSMTYHTGRASGTDGATAVQYRHIENPWGNVFDWVDGVNFNGSTVYVCTDPAKYADDTSAGYTNAGTRASSSGYISALGVSTTAPWAIYPSSTGGSETPTSRTTRGLRTAGLCWLWAAAGSTERIRACSISTAKTARPTRTAASALDSFSSPDGGLGAAAPETL
mgnify:CR=1 FL=1